MSRPRAQPKVTQVRAHNRRRVFELALGRRGRFVFPYAVCDPVPGPEDRIEEVWIDPEVGREGFTYMLRSGAESTVLADHVLHYNDDPAYVAARLAHELSLEASRRWEECGLSVREVARRLGTSPSQIYRLLDPAVQDKGLGKLMGLLHVLGAKVDVTVRDRPAPPG
jgi:hypothetical protein